jgi:hypothetical protein
MASDGFPSYLDAMRTPRVTIWKMCALVAVVAINLAVGRALPDVWPLVFTPMALALQIAAYRLFRRPSAFWAGFVAFGLLAAGSLALAAASDRAEPFTPLEARSLVVQAASYPWRYYIETLDAAMQSFAGSYWRSGKNNPVVIASAFALPQFALALAGGLLMQGVARLRGPTRRPVTVPGRR